MKKGSSKNSKGDALVNLERLPKKYQRLSLLDFEREVAKLAGLGSTAFVHATHCTHPNSVSLYKATLMDGEMNSWIYFFFPASTNGEQHFGIGRKITVSKDEGGILDRLEHTSYGSLKHNPFAAAFNKREAREFSSGLK